MHFGDYTFILLLALVLLGPKKMPEMGRQLGKLLAEFRRASNEFKFQIQEELRNMEDEERRRKLTEAAAATEIPGAPLPIPQPADGPSILPPSTGEPVSADPPFAAPVELPEDYAEIPEAADGLPEPAVKEERSVPEPASASPAGLPAPSPDPAPATESLTHG